MYDVQLIANPNSSNWGPTTGCSCAIMAGQVCNCSGFSIWVLVVVVVRQTLTKNYGSEQNGGSFSCGCNAYVPSKLTMITVSQKLNLILLNVSSYLERLLVRRVSSLGLCIWNSSGGHFRYQEMIRFGMFLMWPLKSQKNPFNGSLTTTQTIYPRLTLSPTCWPNQPNRYWTGHCPICTTITTDFPFIKKKQIMGLTLMEKLTSPCVLTATPRFVDQWISGVDEWSV